GFAVRFHVQRVGGFFDGRGEVGDVVRVVAGLAELFRAVVGPVVGARPLARLPVGSLAGARPGDAVGEPLAGDRFFHAFGVVQFRRLGDVGRHALERGGGGFVVPLARVELVEPPLLAHGRQLRRDWLDLAYLFAACAGALGGVYVEARLRVAEWLLRAGLQVERQILQGLL